MKNYKKILIQFLVILLVLIGFFTMVVSLEAHELIPKELQEYVQKNPNATPEQIRKFAVSQTPEFANKFENWAEILKIIRNDQTSLFDNMYDFFRIGVGHILSGPDHILFVLSLLLVFISWKDILKLTGIFTIAHSITLILAGTGILVLSSRIVEPMIALSIAYVALTSVFLKGKLFVWNNRSKMVAIFFFGLFHGLGFAGLLQEINIPKDKFISSLLAFNLGIEWGQLIIVWLAFPIIYLYKNKKWYNQAIQIFSTIIIFIALYWFVERIINV